MSGTARGFVCVVFCHSGCTSSVMDIELFSSSVSNLATIYVAVHELKYTIGTCVSFMT